MPAKILDGEKIASKIREQIAHDIQQRNQQNYRSPALAVVLIGDDTASKLYVKNKKNACKQVGMTTIDHDLPSTVSQTELLALIRQMNDDPKIDGILVQLPLPKHINPKDIFEAVDPRKDVDGFHPYNVGRLAQGRPYMRPCTAAGIMLLLEHTKIHLRGKKAAVIGTSAIVGQPMILELINAGVTVTACQKSTANLASEIADADILIVATGNPELIKGEWIKPGCVVIDVGINHTPNGKLIGDVEFSTAAEHASWITPVPGGVGPMTIASLLNNCLLANINYQL